MSGGAKVSRVGVILVHGIGEQRRYEHLDEQGREIIHAIARQVGGFGNATVEIGTGPAAAFHAEQDTWPAGKVGPVRVAVKAGGVLTHDLRFHEVWWGDVNERYSLAKQLRFWLWGLSVWAYPASTGAELHGTHAMRSPTLTPRGSLPVRMRLFLVGVFFLIAACPFGLGTMVVQRLLGLGTPNVLKTLTNYLSGVKLFNQRSRFGAGFGVRPPNADFLDTLDEPPRVSVRRRMIRMIAAAADAGYDRWYVVAHSQGTVAALNGLMETPYAWPGYFDEPSWREFASKGFGGRGKPLVSNLETMPRRPVWISPDEVAYRAKIFEKFAGLLTLGSPIAKFAAIWPGRVSISRIAAFRDDVEWINVFDPLDPVSGVMTGFGDDAAACPPPRNIGYATSSILLVGHVHYLSGAKPGCLANAVARWLLDGGNFPAELVAGRFDPGTAVFERRRIAAWAWWVAAFVGASVAGGASLLAFPTKASSTTGTTATRPRVWRDLAATSAGLVIAGIAGTLLAGLVASHLVFDGADDPLPPDDGRGRVADPAPTAASHAPD